MQLDLYYHQSKMLFSQQKISWSGYQTQTENNIRYLFSLYSSEQSTYLFNTSYNSLVHSCYRTTQRNHITVRTRHSNNNYD